MKTENYEAIVIGGGPAGSTAGGLLARAGRRVLVLEKERFPRHHIGESLLPALDPLYRRLGVDEALRRAGFFIKTGGTYVWGRGRRPWHIAFVNPEDEKEGRDGDVLAYHVQRDVFDRLLLENAARLGATTRQGSTALEPVFEGERLAGLEWRDASGERRRAEAAFYLDASGQSALIASRRGWRRYDAQLRNMAVYSYFRGAKLPRGRARRHITIIDIPDGWIWFIPLSDRVSVGVVCSGDLAAKVQGDLEGFYLKRLRACPEIWPLLEGAERCEPMRLLRDWSYRSERFRGPNFVLVGDAAAFIDPLLSYGVTLAMQSAALAADCIELALRRPEEAERALAHYERRHAERFAQLLDFVKYFYDANRDRRSYFWKARSLLEPAGNRYARYAFSYLISGHPFWRRLEKDAFFLRFFRHLGPSRFRGKAVELGGAADDLSVLDLELGAAR